MRVLFASAEFAPIARVGGLAAAAAGLVKALRADGVEVEVVLPDYSGEPLSDERLVELVVPAWIGDVTVRRGVHDHLGPVTLVDVPGMRRAHPYLRPDGTGHPDNDKRFFAFSAVVAALCDHDTPDILHVNDWHTAGALGHLTRPVGTVLTIHTLGYQGHSDPGWTLVFGDRAGAFEFGGACNPLAGGIRLADRVIAVSPNYAAESVTVDGGFGLHELLAARGDDFVGILNGIDAEEWDPADDAQLDVGYDVADTSAKAHHTAALRQRFGLAEDNSVLAVVVTRLVDQKGVDLLLPSIPHLRRLPLQLAVLGSGDLWLADALRDAAMRHPDRVAFHDGYDEALAHQLFAGGELFLMPSRFEPCGLAQMQAMRYGTLPVVTDVGGLHDTVVDVDAEPAKGTGIVATTLDATGVLDALHRAVRAYRQPARRAAMRRRGMSIDWSWSAPARRHIELYGAVLADS